MDTIAVLSTKEVMVRLFSPPIRNIIFTSSLGQNDVILT